MDQKLLCCVAFHFVPDRLKYLRKVLQTVTDYYTQVHIIIDTNVSELPPEYTLNNHPNIEVVSHLDLGHPFYLTRCHRQHFKNNIDKFDVVMYLEDDMYLPYNNYYLALQKYEFLWTVGAVPSFVRIEVSEGKQFISDVTKQIKLTDEDIVELQRRYFAALPFPNNYNGFWMMPTKYLKDNMTSDFTKMTEAREWSAMYPSWELGKKGLIEIYKQGERWKIHPNNFSWHLPNNYIGSPMGNATIEVKNVFI